MRQNGNPGIQRLTLVGPDVIKVRFVRLPRRLPAPARGWRIKHPTTAKLNASESLAVEACSEFGRLGPFVFQLGACCGVEAKTLILTGDVLEELPCAL